MHYVISNGAHIIQVSEMCGDPGGLRAHARRYRELKGRDPTWEISSQATE
jgi:hypothetical protein